MHEQESLMYRIRQFSCQQKGLVTERKCAVNTATDVCGILMQTLTSGYELVEKSADSSSMKG